MDDYGPLKVFICIFGISSLSGLASLLRSDRPLTPRSVFSAMLNAGILGMSIAMIWELVYGIRHVWFITGVSLIAGLGGTTLMDVLYLSIQGGLKIYVERLSQAAPLPLEFQHKREDSHKPDEPKGS